MNKAIAIIIVILIVASIVVYNFVKAPTEEKEATTGTGTSTPEEKGTASSRLTENQMIFNIAQKAKSAFNK